MTDAAVRAAAVFAQKVLEEAASQTGQALSAGARRLVAWIRHRGGQDAKTGAAVAMVSADPNDQDSIELLGRVLAARVAGNPELVRRLQELVADAPEAVTVGDQAQVGVIVSGSSIGGQGGHGPRRPARWSARLPVVVVDPVVGIHLDGLGGQLVVG
jgi:hypothetical protein